MKLLLSQENANINQKLKINTKKVAALHIQKKTHYIVKMLLHAAIEAGNLKIAKVCLDRPEIDVDIPFLVKRNYGEIEEQISPLYLAVSSCNIDIYELLLNQQKIDVKVISIIKPSYYRREKINRTALYAAVQNKKTEIIKLLLQQKKIDVNVVDENSKKPIDYSGEEEIKKLF